jgi:hypothetical protein
MVEVSPSHCHLAASAGARVLVAPVVLLSVHWVPCWVAVVKWGWVLVLFGAVEGSWLAEVWEVSPGDLDCQNRMFVVEMGWRGGEFSSQAPGFFP